jgi:hypothetical protein
MVTRLAPDRAPDVVALMHAMEFPVLDELGLFDRHSLAGDIEFGAQLGAQRPPLRSRPCGSHPCGTRLRGSQPSHTRQPKPVLQP